MRPGPGLFAICATCVHLARGMAHQGHPRPCKAVTWEGPVLHVPTITGERCEEFEPINSCDTTKIENCQLVCEEINAANGTMPNDEFIALCIDVASHTGQLDTRQGNEGGS